MIELNIEDIKKELEGLSYMEKLHAINNTIQDLENLYGKIDDAIYELANIRYSDSCMHYDEVFQNVLQHIRKMIENGKLQQDRINLNDHEQRITVSSVDGNVDVNLHSGHNNLLSGYDGLWQIAILPQFNASDEECQFWRANFAEKLNRPHEFQNDAIVLTVDEETLKDSVFEVIVKLCEENTAKNQ